MNDARVAVSRLPFRFWLLLAGTLGGLASPARAEQNVSAFVGGWAYELSGEITNGATLDFERDLGLKASDRQSYSVNYRVEPGGWIPSVGVDYQRIRAEGRQTIAATVGAPTPALEPLFGGLPVGAGRTVEDDADLGDLEVNALWSWPFGPVRLSGGVTLAWLDGDVRVADASSGASRTQSLSEVFPLLSAAVEWQPIESLRLSLRGDYIQYQDDAADSLEATVFWKMLGPVGLEAGYRQRHYRVKDSRTDIDARLAGARVGIRLELPI